MSSPARPSRSDRGSLTAFVAVVATAMVLVAGMAYDGGAVLTAHATARSYAAKAARAGAQQIDLDVLRSSGGVVLDPSAAVAAAQSYLATVSANGSVTVDDDTVTVTVTRVQPMHILPLPARTVVATEAATATQNPGLAEQGEAP
jgi:hypothetical protein